MILSFATTTLATSFYLDMITDGSYELTHEIAFHDDSNKKPDVSGYILGIDYPINRFKLGLEYIKTEADINADEKELSSIEIKGGFKFADNGRRVWHLTFCQLDNDYKAASIKSSANLIGLDYLRHFSKRVYLDGSLAYPISSEFEESGVKADDCFIYSYRLKLNFLVSDNIGVSLGYRSISSWAEYTNLRVTISDYMNTATLGIVYRF